MIGGIIFCLLNIDSCIYKLVGSDLVFNECLCGIVKFLIVVVVVGLVMCIFLIICWD